MIDLLDYSNQELKLWIAVETIIDRINFVEENFIEKSRILDLISKVRVLEIRIEAAENTHGVLDGYIKQVSDKLKEVEFNEESNHAALIMSIDDLELQVKKVKARFWQAINKTNKRVDVIQMEIAELTATFEKLKI